MRMLGRGGKRRVVRLSVGAVFDAREVRWALRPNPALTGTHKRRVIGVRANARARIRSAHVRCARPVARLTREVEHRQTGTGPRLLGRRHALHGTGRSIHSPHMQSQSSRSVRFAHSCVCLRASRVGGGQLSIYRVGRSI
jgi:hypothetical protein